MTKPVIAIDIDDVLADNAAGFVEYSNTRWGTSLKPSEYSEHWAEVWKISLEEAAGRALEFYDSEVFKAYHHDEQALPVLARLSQDYTLVIVTSRRLTMREGTAEWIHHRYPGIFTEETIYFAGMWDDTSVDIHTRLSGTKGDLYESLGASYVIDDHLKHCTSAVALGAEALLFGDYTWNQTIELPPHTKRVIGWKEVEAYFYDKSES